jgi:CO/xanthine dehydrogenase Mo-binding subunit
VPFDEGTAESLGGVLVAGPYTWPAFDVRAYGVRTNRFGVGAYRGPSAPPSAMALETLIDELATELGIDPIEIRRRNLPGEGAPMVDGETWPVTGGSEVLDAMAASPSGRTGRARAGEGVGLALGYWPGATNAAAAACRMSADGSVQVMTGVGDMSGVAGGFQAIVADALGIEPDASSSSSSTPTRRRPRRAAAAARSRTRPDARSARPPRSRRGACSRRPRSQLEISVDDLELVDGAVEPRGTPEKAIPIAKLVRAQRARRARADRGHGRAENPSLAPSVSGHIARVRVDRETGAIDVLEDHVVQDVGRVLNAALVAASSTARRRRASAGRRSSARPRRERPAAERHVPRLRAAARRGRRAAAT